MVGERTGLDTVSIAVLECLEELDAKPARTYVKSARVVDHLYASRGIPASFGYEALCLLAQDWLTTVLLVDFHGNHGSADPHDRPAAPRYTECRIAPTGVMALASERGELPRLPVGLINGDLALGGTAPPFDPECVATAVHAAAAGDVSDATLIEMVGPPSLPTGCQVEIDGDALATGSPTKLRMSAVIHEEEGPRGPLLVLSDMPFGSSAESAGEAIAHRVDAAALARETNPELYGRMTIPLRDVRNESSGSIIRLVCELRPDADVELCRQRLLETWPVSIERSVQLRAPLAALVRQFGDDAEPQRQAMNAWLRLR